MPKKNYKKMDFFLRAIADRDDLNDEQFKN